MSADAQARTATVGDITLLVCTQFSSPCILLRQRRRERIFFGDEMSALFTQDGRVILEKFSFVSPDRT
jgi:hypothetical protein